MGAEFNAVSTGNQNVKPNRPVDIWINIDRRGDNECWPYNGSTFSGRYGRFFLYRKNVLAHRVVFEIQNGAIPFGMFVMHKCNNKLCCNPVHLTLGNNSENQRHASASEAFQVGVTGIRGIGFDKKRGYWTAHGYLNGKKRNLYTGPHKHKALSARNKWETENLIYFNKETMK